MKKCFVIMLVFICALFYLKEDVWSYIEDGDFKGNEIDRNSTEPEHDIVELKLIKTLAIDSLSIDKKNPKRIPYHTGY
jgi:hypothetical protein